MTTLASIPASINCRISELAQHEYWGEAFADGECEFLIAKKENGKLILVCTHGTWDSIMNGMKEWDTINLQHTQSGAITYTVSGAKADVVTKDNIEAMVAKYGNNKIATWTLK